MSAEVTVMIDVHAHVLPSVDDGSPDVESSLALLEEEVSQGVTDVICTPHDRRGVFTLSNEEISRVFEDFSARVRQACIPVRLYCGREITYSPGFSKRLKNGECMTLAGGRYLLFELPYKGEIDIEEACYGISLRGYVPVLAHAERFSLLRNVELLRSLKRSGVKIQVNASSIARISRGKEHFFAMKLIRLRLADYVGSDVHRSRPNDMAKAYRKVAKIDRAYAEAVFCKNEEEILSDASK